MDAFRAWTIIVLYLVMTGLTFGYIIQVEFPPPHDKDDVTPAMSAVFGSIIWPISVPMLFGQQVFVSLSEHYELTGQVDNGGPLYHKVK
jgi:hypothetical protein